jgi:hypothetical protein
VARSARYKQSPNALPLLGPSVLGSHQKKPKCVSIEQDALYPNLIALLPEQPSPSTLFHVTLVAFLNPPHPQTLTFLKLKIEIWHRR